MNTLSLTVVMPALNEKKNIEEAVNSTLKAFKSNNVDGEIIVVNDGSTDETKEIVENISKINGNVKLINHQEPMGIGYSFMDGVKASRKDAVVMFPGDDENDANDALSYFSLMNQVDIIVPFVHNTEIRNKKRRILSSLYRFIINMTFGINLNYTNGTVFYRRCILDDISLRSHGFFYQAELLIKLIRKGYLFAEVPNFLSVREGGKSKATTLKSLFMVIMNFLRLAFYIHVRRIESKRDYSKLSPNSISFSKYSFHNSGKGA